MSGEAMDAAARALCAEMTGSCECASPPGEPACTGPKIMASAAIVAFLRHAQASEEAGTAFLRASDGDVEQVDSSWLEAAYRAEADALDRAATPDPGAAPMSAETDFHYFECPECGFSSVQRADFTGSECCPLCAGDSGHDVRMRRRRATPEDQPEGRDARLDRAATPERT